MKSLFNEPSTWAGIGLVATGISNILAKDYNTGIPQLMAGLVAVFKREAKNG